VFFSTRLFSKYWWSMINEQKRGSQPDLGEASPLQSSTRNGKSTKTHMESNMIQLLFFKKYMHLQYVYIYIILIIYSFVDLTSVCVHIYNYLYMHLLIYMLMWEIYDISPAGHLIIWRSNKFQRTRHAWLFHQLFRNGPVLKWEVS
jgi:hypothetical protein